MCVENAEIAAKESTAIGGRVFVEWDRDSDGQIVGGQWRREAAGVIVEFGPLRKGDKIAKDTVITPDGRHVVVDERIISAG